jgi:hypothetical protein
VDVGTLQYQPRYPQGAPGQMPNMEPGSVLFPDRGVRLGGRFLDYWQAHDGLSLMGVPISDELIEVSEVDGREYRVQYFERVVMEYHPENPPPYEVLLGHLGRLHYQLQGPK